MKTYKNPNTDYGMQTSYNLSHSTGRNGNEIDTITIHCTACEVDADDIQRIFNNPAKKASCNIGVGKTGDTCMVVDLNDRSWCSSNGDNDRRAITFEVSSKNYEPYEMTKESIDSLKSIIIEICLDNDLDPNELRWTFHRDFAAKACPGDWFMDQFDIFKEEVLLEYNSLMKASEEVVNPAKLDKWQVCAYKGRDKQNRDLVFECLNQIDLFEGKIYNYEKNDDILNTTYSIWLYTLDTYAEADMMCKALQNVNKMGLPKTFEYFEPFILEL